MHKSNKNTGVIVEYVTEEDDGVSNGNSEENEYGIQRRKNTGAGVDRTQSDSKVNTYETITQKQLLMNDKRDNNSGGTDIYIIRGRRNFYANVKFFIMHNYH